MTKPLTKAQRAALKQIEFYTHSKEECSGLGINSRLLDRLVEHGYLKSRGGVFMRYSLTEQGRAALKEASDGSA